jgi:hypothetical protein
MFFFETLYSMFLQHSSCIVGCESIPTIYKAVCLLFSYCSVIQGKYVSKTAALYISATTYERELQLW